MDLPPELFLHTDPIKAASMLQFPEKLCLECGFTLREEGVISRCILNVKQCMLCNHKYCPPHFMYHIQECILIQSPNRLLQLSLIEDTTKCNDSGIIFGCIFTHKHEMCYYCECKLNEIIDLLI